MNIRTWITTMIAAGALALAACDKKPASSTTGGPTPGPAAGGAIELGFVTNNTSDFWAIAASGVKKAEQDFNVKVEIKMPNESNLQETIIESLISKKVSGIAISPKDSKNQIGLLNKVRDAGINLICFDSDAPDSKRMAFVGTNNVLAGVAAGELILEALPQGGKIMLFVGSMDAQNAKERRQGVEQALKGSKVEVLDVRTDNEDRARAKQNVEDTLNKYPDVACLVGLWSYNAPQILQAVKDAKKEGKVKIVAFDEEGPTLQGVKDGHIYGTVVQQPYEFGYRSIKYLAHMARGETDKLPKDGMDVVPVRKIKPADVDAFSAELKKLIGK